MGISMLECDRVAHIKRLLRESRELDAILIEYSQRRRPGLTRVAQRQLFFDIAWERALKDAEPRNR